MALERTRLPVVSRVMTSDWRIGTPEESSVPRVRVKRETAERWARVPMTGSLSLSASKKYAPASVLPITFTITKRATAAMKIMSPLCCTNSEAWITNSVTAGSDWPPSMSLNTCLNFGITITRRNAVMPIAAKRTTLG